MSNIDILRRQLEDVVKYADKTRKMKDGRAQKGYVTSANRNGSDYVKINGRTYEAESAVDMELFKGLPVYVQVTPTGKAVVVGSA